MGRYPLAAVTMVYNEPYFLPRWIAHHAREVGGAEHCYVIDHGSDDGSTAPGAPGIAGANILRLPRSPSHDDFTAWLVGDFCADLLGRYGAVAHADADEFLLADPARFANLAAYAAAMPADTIHAVGLDLGHMPQEAPLDPGRPILEQRGWVGFSAAVCKPALTRVPAAFAPGFHCLATRGAPIVFDRLFLVHLRFHDAPIGLARLAKTRGQAWAEAEAGLHARKSDEGWLGDLAGLANRPRAAADRLDIDWPPLADQMRILRETMTGREGEIYKFALHVPVAANWPVPAAWRGRF